MSLVPDVETYTQAEVVRLLRSLGADMQQLRAEVHGLTATFVTKAEFEAWRTAYDRELRDVKQDAANARAAAAPVRVSGWTIAGFAVSALVGLGSLLGLTITLINVIP